MDYLTTRSTVRVSGELFSPPMLVYQGTGLEINATKKLHSRLSRDAVESTSTCLNCSGCTTIACEKPDIELSRVFFILSLRTTSVSHKPVHRCTFRCASDHAFKRIAHFPSFDVASHHVTWLVNSLRCLQINSTTVRISRLFY